MLKGNRTFKHRGTEEAEELWKDQQEKRPILSAKNAKRMGRRISISEGLAADEGPAFDGAQIAGLPIRMFAFQDEAGIDDEVESGFVLKADVDGVIVTCGVDLGELDDLALEFFKAVELAAAIAADGGFAALDDFGRRQARDASAFSGFGFG